MKGQPNRGTAIVHQPAARITALEHKGSNPRWYVPFAPLVLEADV